MAIQVEGGSLTMDTLAGIPQVIEGTLKNAQVLTLFSIPTLVIPAQGAGTLIVVTNYMLENLNGGVAYTLGGNIALCYDANTTLLATGAFVSTFLTTPVVTQVAAPGGNFSTSQAVSSVANKGLYLACLTQDFATGTGTLKYNIAFRVIKGV